MENKTEKTEIRVISYGKENLQNDEETRLRLLENKVRHYKDYLDHKPKKNKVAFLDRDGILNVDKGYLYKIEDLEWMPHVKEGIGLLCNLGFKVVVVTNQSGIARGYYTVADMEKLHAYMEQEIEKENVRSATSITARICRKAPCLNILWPVTAANPNPG